MDKSDLIGFALFAIVSNMNTGGDSLLPLLCFEQ